MKVKHATNIDIDYHWLYNVCRKRFVFVQQDSNGNLGKNCRDPLLTSQNASQKTVSWVWHLNLRQVTSWDNMLCDNILKQNLIILNLYQMKIYKMIISIVWKDLANYLIVVNEYLSREIWFKYTIFSTAAPMCWSVAEPAPRFAVGTTINHTPAIALGLLS